MTFAALTIDLNARLAKFEDDMARVRKSMGGIEKSASVLKTGLGGLFAGVGVAGLVAFAKNGIDAADALKDMSDRLGVSVKDLASFKLAAEQNGTELETLGKGIARLTRSIGEAEGGNKKLGEALKALGITARDPKEAFFQLADATEKIQDPAKRAALLSQVLGKSYQDLIPFLSQGSEELRKSAQGSETFAQAMERLAPDADLLNDNLAKLKENAAGFAATLLGPVAKAMNETIEGFKRIDRLSDAGASFDDFFFGTVNADTGKSLRNINKEIDGVEARIKRAKGFGIFGDTAPLERELTRLKAIRAELHNLTAEQLLAPHTSKSKKLFGDINIPAEKAKGSSAKATDPLASLLSQTDTAKFAEYTKLQDLLTARFEKGAIKGKQYAEALTVLRKGYYTDELKAYADQLEYNLETERLVADHLKETEAALREQKNAWAEAGRALEDEMRTPLERLNLELERYRELLDRGDISLETYNRGVSKVRDEMKAWGDETNGVTDLFKSSFQEMGNALSTFVTTGKLDFKSLVKTMLQGFAQIAFQKALLNIAGSLFGGSSFGAGAAAKVAGGSLGTTPFSQQSVMLAQQIYAKGGVQSGPGISAFSGQIVSKPTLFPFAKGIGLMGEAGAEAILPLKRGKDGKLGVGAAGGGSTVVNYISVDATGSKVEGDQGKSGELARKFADGVRAVLIQEQRNGGLLA